QIIARIPGVAIRLPAKGGTPQLYRLPRLTPVDGVLRGRLPPVERVVGLDPESEFLFVTTAKHQLLGLDLGSGRVDTVATSVAHAALGPDGTLYAIDDQRHVVSLSRRTRFAWPQALTAMPRDLFGSTDQRLVGVIPQDRLLVAAPDQPSPVPPIAARRPCARSRRPARPAGARGPGGRGLRVDPPRADQTTHRHCADAVASRSAGDLAGWYADFPARHGRGVDAARFAQRGRAGPTRRGGSLGPLILAPTWRSGSSYKRRSGGGGKHRNERRRTALRADRKSTR